MKLDARAFGVATGAIAGVAVCGATLLSISFGKGRTIDALAAVFLGYTRSFGGAFVGLLWGAFYGFVLGWLLATLYNRLARPEP